LILCKTLTVSFPRECSINSLRSSAKTGVFDRSAFLLAERDAERVRERERERGRERERERGRERERERERERNPASLPHFYCRKSGDANAPVTRRFPVTCCPLSVSPGGFCSRDPLPRGDPWTSGTRASKIRSPALPGWGSGRPSRRIGSLESTVWTFGTFSRIRTPLSDANDRFID